MKQKLPFITAAFLSGFLGSTALAQEFPQQNGSVNVSSENPACQPMEGRPCSCDCPEPAAVIIPIHTSDCPSIGGPAVLPQYSEPSTPQETRQRTDPSLRQVQRAMTLTQAQSHYALALGEVQALRQLIETGTHDAGELQARVEELQGSCTDFEQQFLALRLDYALSTANLREELRQLEELIQRGPIFTVRPGLGVEVYDGTPAGLVTTELCARAADNDLLGLCLGGTLYVIGSTQVAEDEISLPPEQRTHEGDYTSTSTGWQTMRTETEGLGALSIAANIRAVQSNPSVDVQLGAAVRFTEQRTVQATDRTDRLYNPEGILVGTHSDRYEEATPEELTDLLIPYAGIVLCRDALCIDTRAGIGVEDGSFLFQGALRYEIE